MRTPEEIVTALRCCAKSDTHCVLECPYKSDSTDINCMQIFEDAAALIEQLEETIDLMKLQMRGDCGTCKHRDARGEPCDTCGPDHNRPAWEYEGLPELPHG